MASKKGAKKGKKPRSRGRARGLTLEMVNDLLVKEFGDRIEGAGIRDKGRSRILGFSVPNKLVFPVCEHLHRSGFEHCSLISAIDWKDRFEIVYHITSYQHVLLVEMRTTLPHERPDVDSVSSIWGGANWHEREAWDLMGINFVGHPKLKRLLLPKDFEGHPLRKDYKGVP
jgi:NADH/F420H2 dehydrogenase subunit C